MNRGHGFIVALFLFQTALAMNLDTVIFSGCAENIQPAYHKAAHANQINKDSIDIIGGPGIYDIRVTVYRNCCAEFSTDFIESRDTLYMFINESNEMPCDCNCHFPFSFVVSDLTPKKYFLSVINNNKTILTSEFIASSVGVLPTIKNSPRSGRVERDDVYDLRGRRIDGKRPIKGQLCIIKAGNAVLRHGLRK